MELLEKIITVCVVTYNSFTTVIKTLESIKNKLMIQILLN